MIPLKDDTPTQTTPIVTIILIAINIAVFLYQLTLSDRAEFIFAYRYGAVPLAITHFIDPFPGDGVPVAMTVFSSMFLHGGVFHLIGNMLFLWIFGNNVEDSLGHFRFVVFYLLCGVVATLAFIVTDPGSRQPLVGASGAISGVMGAYLLLYPRARVLTMIILVFYPLFVWIPAVVFLVLWFIMQVISAGGSYQSSVAWTAHIGGFICGLIVLRLMLKKRPPRRLPPIPSPPPARSLPPGRDSYRGF